MRVIERERFGKLISRLMPDDVHFLTMEMIDGRPLQEMIPPEGLPTRRVVELAVAMSDAVAAAHDKDLVHRDLKPAIPARIGQARMRSTAWATSSASRMPPYSCIATAR